MADRNGNGAMMTPQVLGMAMLIAISGLSTLAQEQPTDKPVAPISETEESKRSREELQVSLEQVTPMRLQHAITGAAIERVERPVLRYSAPLWGGHHGTLWIWGRQGRPVGVLEMSLVQKDGLWYRSFHSTTDTPLKLDLANGKSWTPKLSNVKFQPLPNAPPPADSQAGRLRQMKSFIQNFAAHQLWTWPEGDGSRHELRLLTTPVHRYEDRDHQLIDGALFIIAQGTNPEATLFLEAVTSIAETTPYWQFGIGRSSFAEQIVNYENKVVYHEPPVKYDEIFDSSNSYWRTTSKITDADEQEK